MSNQRREKRGFASHRTRLPVSACFVSLQTNAHRSITCTSRRAMQSSTNARGSLSSIRNFGCKSRVLHVSSVADLASQAAAEGTQINKVWTEVWRLIFLRARKPTVPRFAQILRMLGLRIYHHLHCIDVFAACRSNQWIHTLRSAPNTSACGPRARA